MAMFDVNKIEDEVRKEMAEERADEARARIKSHLVKIQKAEQVVENLKMEYKVMLADIAGEV